MNQTDATPLMRQYRDIKRAHQDAILLFRVGDFYEMFYQDAEVAAGILNIALTTRDKNRPDPVPLCGVPYHAAMTYIARLLKAGRTVALCDQVEDPKSAKGLVKRAVVRVYTPGTLIDSELVPPSETVRLAAITARPENGRSLCIGLGVLDSSTGEFWVMEFTGPSARTSLCDVLARVEAREVVLPSNMAAELTDLAMRVHVSRAAVRTVAFDRDAILGGLLKHFGASSTDELGCGGLRAAVDAAATALAYVQETQPMLCLRHITALAVRRPCDTMQLDSTTIRNLELLKPLRDEHREATLLNVLDHTATAIGSRLLREWIIHPLVELEPIHARLDAVEEFVHDIRLRTDVRTLLRGVQDLARLAGRVAMGVAGPRDINALKDSIAMLPQLHAAMSAVRSALLRDLTSSWDSLEDLHQLIDKSLRPDAPASVRDGGIIQDGYHPEVDGLRTTCREGKGWIASLEARERESTAIDSLKIRFNQVFGYYIEVTKANAGRVPERFVRKQTLANAERFTTAELQQLEAAVLSADSKLLSLEKEVFEEVIEALGRSMPRVRAMSDRLAALDVVSALAEVSAIKQYVKPVIDDSGALHIVGGRHPVVEHVAPVGTFIPNDTSLDLSTQRLVILTGPNMAGKSTYLRQIALIVLMAQIGCFAPAAEARIGLVDRIFTRVGASDNLAAGQSTFMMEMTETADILKHATRRSLILLDEIGRGTSTYDGLSLAWAIAEYIVDPTQLGARTLFATHYHEMTELPAVHPGARNCSVLVRERNGELLFLRKIIEGGADRSYGIHVARLAGLPASIIERATTVLHRLESATEGSRSSTGGTAEADDDRSPQPHTLLEEVRQMDLFSMTPLEALNKLADLQRRLEGDS